VTAGDARADGAAFQLIHPEDIFQEQSARPEFLEQGDELAVEAIAGILDHAVVTMDLAERLAGRAVGKEVEPRRAGDIDKLAMLAVLRQISRHEQGTGEVLRVRRAAVGVMIGGRDDCEAP
jgi:hypothetical protein